jgi:hypothetical protein
MLAQKSDFPIERHVIVAGKEPVDPGRIRIVVSIKIAANRKRVGGEAGDGDERRARAQQ